jgi:hypothetical protein
MRLDQFRAEVEQPETWYPFQQVVRVGDRTVPIEHTLILASRRQGQTITTVRGTFVNETLVDNRLVLSPGAAARVAFEALSAVPGVDVVTSSRARDGPDLVLLPDGTTGDGRFRLRHAYRMVLDAVSRGHRGRFLLWLDADDGRLLKLEPLFGTAAAVGRIFRRDPEGDAPAASFQVDAPTGGAYFLRLSGVANRVRFRPDASEEVVIADTERGDFANFDQAPLNAADQAMCDTGTNKGFQQVNLLARIVRYRDQIIAQGLDTTSQPFPRWGPWNPMVEASFCNANAGMEFGVCPGYYHTACPDYARSSTPVTQADYDATLLNWAHDATIVAHEFGHNVTYALGIGRPPDWCDPSPGVQACGLPIGFLMLEDLADFWAGHLESTNCVGGWVAKNVGGTNASRHCALHNALRLPRKHAVSDGSTSGDHFPESRVAPAMDQQAYSDGQIAAAALWEVRQGMRSKCRPSGTPMFGVRTLRALEKTGLVGNAPPRTDHGVFRVLYDLLIEMIAQWADSGSPGGAPAFAHNGAHTINKVTAGFARAGIFAIPVGCLDGTGGASCAPGGSAGDAVVDIDDNDPSDDLTVDGVAHPERDFLRLGDTTTFLVWTGPRYRFLADESADEAAPQCNTEFKVEVSTDPGFPPAQTRTSNWLPVPAGQCFATWPLGAADWQALQSGDALSRIYYRARTRDAAGNERISTEPAGGLWGTVPPAYAVITPDGKSDY